MFHVLPRAGERGADHAHASADTIRSAVRDKAAPDAGAVAGNALSGVYAISFARQRGADADANCGIDACPLRRRSSHSGAGLMEARGGGHRGGVDVSAQNTQRETFAAAAPEGGRGEGSYGCVGIEGASASALTRGCEREDGSVVGEKVVGCRHGIGRWVGREILRHVRRQSGGRRGRREGLIEGDGLSVVMVAMREVQVIRCACVSANRGRLDRRESRR